MENMGNMDMDLVGNMVKKSQGAQTRSQGELLGSGLNLGPQASSSQSSQNSNGKGKIKTSVARKLFGDEKAKLAMDGAEVSNSDGDVLTYENGSFFLA